MIKKVITKYYLFIYLSVVFISILNVVFYPEFVLRYLRVNPILIYISFVAISFLHKIYKVQKDTYVDILFYKFNILILSLSFVTLLLTNIVEDLTYKNFIFSRFHIHPSELIYPFFVILVEIIFSLNLKDAKNRVGEGLKKAMNIKTIILPFVILIFINNILGVFDKMQKDAKYLIQNPFSTKKEIMKFKVGKLFYNYSEFIISNTEPTSKILLPPFPVYPWPQTGNAVYFRYFLYPRTLYGGREYEPNIDLNKIDYVLVAWGETPTTSSGVTHGWPKFDVVAEYILFLNKDGSTAKVEGNYNYAKYKNVELWGIIKVKR